jgi:subtilisin family serine protease
VLTSASNIVVAVLDTGVLHTHEDLATNMWVNPIDGSPGWNALTGTNNPADGDGHGTLVSGIIGAAGDNSKGVVGVAWRVQMMAAKCFNTLGDVGFDSDVIACIDFARTNGARIINASFSGTGFSQSLSNAIYGARNDGIIVVASAGNNAADVDAAPRYPACYEIDNIVSVAATTRSDALWPSSNYGATNVDLAAPGHQIYSTFFINNSFYLGPVAGTSLAAPYVTGTLALMLAKYPAETHQQIIARVLNATDPLPSLTGKCVTGGRLNLRKALSPPINLTVIPTAPDEPFRLRVFAGPSRSCVVEATTNLTSWTPVLTNITSASGTFDFTDGQSINSPKRFFRVVSAL